MRFQLLSRTEILQKLFSDSSMDGGMRTSSSSPGGSVSSHESDFKSIVTTTDEPSSVRGSSPIRNSCEIFNLTSPWNCRYVYQPCSARGITNSLRFLHWKSSLFPGVFKVKTDKGPAQHNGSRTSRVELGQGDDHDMNSHTSLSVEKGPQSSSPFANQVGQDHNQSRAVCLFRYLKKCKECKHEPFLGLLSSRDWTTMWKYK